MNTVITPKALDRSSFIRIRYADWFKAVNSNGQRRTDIGKFLFEDAHVFLFPSASVINEFNGDGDLREIAWYNDRSILTHAGQNVPMDKNDFVYIFIGDRL